MRNWQQQQPESHLSDFVGKGMLDTGLSFASLSVFMVGGGGAGMRQAGVVGRDMVERDKHLPTSKPAAASLLYLMLVYSRPSWIDFCTCNCNNNKIILICHDLSLH